MGVLHGIQTAAVLTFRKEEVPQTLLPGLGLQGLNDLRLAIRKRPAIARRYFRGVGLFHRLNLSGDERFHLGQDGCDLLRYSQIHTVLSLLAGAAAAVRFLLPQGFN